MRDDDRVRVLHMIDAADAVAQFMTVNDQLPALLPDLRALCQWMESEDFTQAQAAKRLGIAQPRVSDIVRGKVDLMSLDYLVGLCAKAGVSVEVRLAA